MSNISRRSSSSRADERARVDVWCDDTTGVGRPVASRLAAGEVSVSADGRMDGWTDDASGTTDERAREDGGREGTNVSLQANARVRRARAGRARSGRIARGHTAMRSPAVRKKTTAPTKRAIERSNTPFASRIAGFGELNSRSRKAAMDMTTCAGRRARRAEDGCE